MKVTRILACFAALLSFTPAPFAASINFDDFNASSGLVYGAADHYRSSGVVFSQNIPFWNLPVMEPFAISLFTNTGGTLPNEIQLDAETVFHIDMSFVLPGTSTPATTDFVQALFIDTDVGTTVGTIQAFDINNHLLDSETMITPSSYGAVLTVSAPNISWVRFSEDADGGGMDNLVFHNPVPEPSGLALALVGIGALLFSNHLAKRRTGASA